MIEVKELVKMYGTLPAVDRVTFSVPKGAILGLLGPNGAGKTTTMRMLTTALPKTGGKAVVAGFDVTEEPHEVRKRIGYLPEIPPIYHDMQVIPYLKFVADIKEIPRGQRMNRIGEVLEMLSLGDMGLRLIGHLSTGYKQRVGLAQALLHDPEVIVLDEPTKGLDPKQNQEIRKLVKSLSGRKTIILSTHILSEVEATCDRVVIIDKGKVLADDTVENLSQRMAGGKTLEVEIKGPAAEVEKALQKTEGVQAVRALGKESRGLSRFEVITDGTSEAREAVFHCVVKNKWVLFQLTPAGSLEDVFLKLTTKETTPKEVTA